MVADEATVWVVAPGFEAATLLHVDPEHGEVRDPIPIAQPAITVSMVSAFDALWYLTPDRLLRVSASTDAQDTVRRVASPTDLGADGRGVSLAADRDHLWIGQIDGRLMRVDPSGGVEVRRVADAIDLIAATEDGVWVLDGFGGVVIHVDPATLGTVWESPVVGTISRLAVDEDYLWLFDQSSGVLTRLSSSTGAGADQAPVGRGVTNLAVGLGAVWLSHEDGTITRRPLDARPNRVRSGRRSRERDRRGCGTELDLGRRRSARCQQRLATWSCRARSSSNVRADNRSEGDRVLLVGPRLRLEGVVDAAVV